MIMLTATTTKGFIDKKDRYYLFLDDDFQNHSLHDSD